MRESMEALELSWKKFQKIQNKNFRHWLQNLHRKKIVQMAVFVSGSVALLCVAFFLMTQMFGLLVASMAVLILLDQVFGVKIHPSIFSQAFG